MVFSLLFALNLYAKSVPKEVPNSSISERYSALSNDNQARMLFTSGQMDKLKASLMKSPNFKSMGKLLTPLFDGQKIRKSIKLDAHHNIEWHDNGIEKASQIVLVDQTQSNPNQEIYSNFQEGLGIANIIIDFSISPNGKYLDVISSEYGSIDQVECFIIDIKTHEPIAKLHLFSNLRAWNSASSLLYDKLNEDGSETFSQFDLTKLEEADFDGYILGNNNDLVLLENFSETTNWFSIQNKSDSSVVNLDFSLTDSPKLIGSDEGNAYLSIYNSKAQTSEVLKFPRRSSKFQSIETPVVIFQESKLFLEKAWLDSNSIFSQVRAGPDRWLRVNALDGTQLTQVLIPDCCSLLSASWIKPQATMRLSFSSPLYANQSFIYDLSTQKWDQDPNDSMLNDRDLHLISEVIYSTSKDGTRIPSRLIHLKEINLDSTHPAIIQAYGGFNLAGYIDPHFDSTNLEFIKRGGIYAAPAIRGGNEYGPSWHSQAILTNKNKSFEDMASLSDFLVAQKWTKPSLVIARGTSNGGLTVAASALLFPDKFGMSIPIAGVLDLLAKDSLDSVNDGWSSEYGSVENQKDYLKSISPVENASQLGDVRFLIVDGANDTRVNPVHSVKLAKALEDLGGHAGQVHLLTMQNAGHWLESVSYQNSIGLKTEIAIWTEIYDLAGWTGTPTRFALDFKKKN